ncbi:hypothetical protein ZOSMA_3G01130 [Zostera marina]|uniref:Bidirectional sugar transporter SWEET n=1 Tax=Zostera marina TaxID=29655 RepID=A0A0K9P605_ZOSMR|nr:hypothetical protein ZOSMA_3G01130 [Zostera marina]
MNPWIFATGLCGNTISFLVFLAPVIYKKKSTESFDSVPYVVALFSATLWFYFALLTNDVLLMSINSIGCVVEGIYLGIFLTYASKKPKVFTIKLVVFMNLCLFGSLLFTTMMFCEGKRRVTIVGWIGSIFAFTVFLSPLSVIRLVIKTESVEYMPFTLSLFLTLSAVAWFCYGFLQHNYYIALPNVLGFLFGITQMGLFAVYMKKEKHHRRSADLKLPQVSMDVVKPDQSERSLEKELKFTMTASGGYRGNKKTMRNTKHFGGNGIPLQTFSNSKSQGTYNPHLIKKQQEVYRNAKLIRKFRKSVKQQERREDCVPAISIPELAESSQVQNKTDPKIVHWKKNEKKNKVKNSLQSAREEYEKTQKEEEKARAERERIARAREEESAKAEGKRKAKRKMMLMKTHSGQPIMKYRIKKLLDGIQGSSGN